MNTENNIKDFNVNGLACHIQGTGEPLVMIHGIMSDSDFFSDCASLLAARYTVITYDRRAYGKSEGSFSDYSVSAQAQDVRDIIKTAGFSSAFILGNSAGGLIGLELALTTPEYVRSLLMLEPSLGYIPEEQKKLKDWNRLLNEYRNNNQAKQVLPEFARVIGAPKSENTSFSMAVLRQTYKNLNAFLEGELNEVQSYLPDRERVTASDVPMSILVTERGRDSIFATSSVSAAEVLGLPIYHLPGYHNTIKDMPSDCAVILHGILSL